MNWQWFVAPGSALYLIPLAALAGIAVMLRSPAGRRPVLVWWGAIAVACLVTAASKIAFYGWGTGIRAWDLTCFSGHTVISLAVWPVVGVLSLHSSHRAWRTAAGLFGIVFATLIAYSRYALRAHSVSEIIAGLLLGGAVALLALHRLRNESVPPLFVPAVVLFGLLASQTHLRGSIYRATTEEWFVDAATALSGKSCVTNRGVWRQPQGHFSVECEPRRRP